MLNHGYKQLISINGIKLKPFDMRKSQPIPIVSLFEFSAIMCFSQHLKHATYMVASHCVVPSLVTLFTFGSYKQCCTRLIKVLHKFCNTDALKVLLIYQHSPLGAAHPWDLVYISVKPLTAVLQ